MMGYSQLSRVNKLCGILRWHEVLRFVVTRVEKERQKSDNDEWGKKNGREKKVGDTGHVGGE